MEYFYKIFLLISCMSCIYTQKFEAESPYMIVRLMDIKSHEWKPSTLDQMEKVLDEELKYTDAKKGTQCRSIDFEQEVGYPKQDTRFLDLSIRGLCTDEKGKVHDINKELIIVAIERNINEVMKVLGANIYSVGNVQFYKHHRNLLNFIIIPISVGLTLILIIATFCLRRYRYAQKKKHIIDKLQEKREASVRKAQTVANIDPNANEKQRLLQLDPTVVGSASDTLGSPKEFTTEQYASSSRNNNTNRERMHVPYENQPRFPVGQSQYDSGHSDMIPMQEQQPRVVVRTIRGDGNQPTYYQQHENAATTFVPIPVQIERSGSHQRFVSPPYHSDPHYKQDNA